MSGATIRRFVLHQWPNSEHWDFWLETNEMTQTSTSYRWKILAIGLTQSEVLELRKAINDFAEGFEDPLARCPHRDCDWRGSIDKPSINELSPMLQHLIVAHASGAGS